MSYPGVTCKIYRQKLDAKIAQEYIGTLDGSGSDQVLYTKNLPITTSAGVATDDETLVDVYTDDGSVGSWTEYLDDGSDFTIVGATGAVTIKAAENQAGNAGERISISYYYRAEVGSGQTSKITWGRKVIERHKLGSADVQELIAGKKAAVALEFDTFYITRDELGGILSETDFYNQLTDFDFYMYPNDVTAGQPMIYVTDIKGESGSVEADLDSLMLNKCKFKGLTGVISTVPA